MDRAADLVGAGLVEAEIGLGPGLLEIARVVTAGRILDRDVVSHRVVVDEGDLVARP